MYLVASMMPRRPIGRLMRKIQCQEKYVVMKPPTGGPSTGPISAGIVTQVMMATSSRLSNERSSTSRPTGDIIAPPHALQEARDHETAERIGERAADRADHEDRQRDAKHVARPEAVGGPAARRNEDREREQVRGDGELERERIGAEIVRDRRQRGRDHRGIHVLHEERDRDDQRYDAVLEHGGGFF